MTKMKRYSELYGTGYAYQLCMERNSVKIIKTNSEEFKKIKIYVDIKYGKTFIKQCKNNKV